MATLAQLRADVRALLGDASSEAASWSDAQVDAAINQACLDYCEKKDVAYVETVVSSDANGIATLPDTCIQALRVMHTT